MLLRSSIMQTTIKLGPFGGEGGNSWDDGVHTTVRRIIICAGDVIDSICIEYDKKGKSVLSPVHGGVGGEKYMVELDYPDEFLISISGYYGSYTDYGILIRSITFQTNLKTYGPFGREIGDQFSVPSNIAKITGFCGKSGIFLDSIGAYVGPTYISVGPYGYRFPDMNCWDDGVYTGVRQLILNVGEVEKGRFILRSICIEYDQDGESVWSPKHGQDTSSGINSVIKLNYPDEFLISFSGYYHRQNHWGAITSLTFQTNSKTYGPFGSQLGAQFSVPSNTGKIVGFNGGSANNLCAIGAHLEEFLHP